MHAHTVYACARAVRTTRAARAAHGRARAPTGRLYSYQIATLALTGSYLVASITTLIAIW